MDYLAMTKNLIDLIQFVAINGNYFTPSFYMKCCVVYLQFTF